MYRSVKITCVFPIILLLLSSSALRGEPDKDAWSQLIGAAGFTRETCRLDQLDLANWGGDDYSLPFYRAMHGDPLRIPFYVMQFRVNMLQSAGSLGNSTIKGGLLIMEGTRINLLGNPLTSFPQCKDEDETVYFMKALKSLSWKDSSNGKDDQSIISTLGKIPPDIRRNAGFLMNVIAKSIEWRNQSLKRLSQKDLEALFSSLSSAKKPFIDEVPRDDLKQIISKINFKYLLRGAEELGFAVDFAVSELSKRSGQEEFSFEVNTPHGVIALNGRQDNKYSGELSYLLVIDTGGNDLYQGGGATANIRNPVSVLIDLEGDDSYLESPELKNISIAEYQERKTAGKPLFGVGILGYGILVDVKGNDVYKSRKNTQGCGLFGVGILQDRSGNDSYDCYAYGQGTAMFGVGMLADLGGADKYQCFNLSQGAAQVKGFGILLDTGAGNDIYDANDTVIDLPSAQTNKHNANMSQGIGFGWRADFTDGYSFAGGIGALIDDGGDNIFKCGVFGQGVGYWRGVGILCSGKGNDFYQGTWYTLGSAAHFAVGALFDEGGDDNYNAPLVSMGAAVDFSAGFLIDYAGNDTYTAGSLCLGSGNANSFGFFWDRAGNDKYKLNDPKAGAFGFASVDKSILNIRDRNITAGFFLDTGGDDVYPDTVPRLKNNILWEMSPDVEKRIYPVLRGKGIDMEAPETMLPW
jgi:hypothetical protein